MSLTVMTSLHWSTAFQRQENVKKKKERKESTIKEVKQSEQFLPAKVRTILYRHAQVLSHHQTTNIKYRLTATDSEPFSLWNTVIRAQHSAQLSFVKATHFDIMFQQKRTKQVQLLGWESLHFSVMCFSLIWCFLNWTFDAFLNIIQTFLDWEIIHIVSVGSTIWILYFNSCFFCWNPTVACLQA